MPPKVAIVLLTYDASALLDRALASVLPQLPPTARLVIVDNGSKNHEATRLTSLLARDPRVSVLRIEKNVGYAAGMNHGIKALLGEHLPKTSLHASAMASAGQPHDWIITLSNDTELDPHFFEALEKEISKISTGQRIGMLAPKVRAMTTRETLDGTGISVCIDGMSTARGQRERDVNQYDSEDHRNVLMPNGVAGIYSSQMLTEVGLFDEDFYAYCEDTDLGLRAWNAGWDCRYLANCVVYHQRSATIGEFSLEKLYLVERNHYWVVIKNFPWPLVLANPIFTCWRFLLQAYSVLTQSGHQSNGYTQHHSAAHLAWATLRGCITAALGAPKMFRKRIAMISNATSSQRTTDQRKTTRARCIELFRKRMSLRKLVS